MEGIIKIGAMFTLFSVITLFVYIKHNQKKRYYNLSYDIISILVYTLTTCFVATSLFTYFA